VLALSKKLTKIKFACFYTSEKHRKALTIQWLKLSQVEINVLLDKRHNAHALPIFRFVVKFLKALLKLVVRNVFVGLENV